MNLIMVLFKAGSLEVFKIGGKPGIYWKNKDFPMGKGAFSSKGEALMDYYKTTGESVADAVMKSDEIWPPAMPAPLRSLTIVQPSAEGHLIEVDFKNKRRIS